MRWVKWIFYALLALTVFLFFDYNLPSHSVVRIVATNTQRMDLGSNRFFFSPPASGTSGTNKSGSGRDIKFIQAIRPNGQPIVFRNEDTGWGWPPYFKFDSFDLETEASNYISTQDKPKWVMVTYYGWRSQFLTIFPNAVGLRVVADPKATVFPWVTVIVLGGLLMILLFLRRVWVRFRRRRIAPVLEEVSDVLEEADSRARGFWRRMGGG
ncbi:MAG: DUF1523 family protein [Paracoccaceae bacterium]|nr:DUF1523 family protein [Paracoccaceae bacterium]MDE3123446.1 DUF1523 family protein [Paracoccaceae bacterium]